MIVKSSFSTSGGRGASNLGYINREGSFEGGRAAVIDREGNVLHKEDFRELRQVIKEADMERRLIFSPKDPDVSKDEIGSIVRDVLERYQVAEERDFEYVYAVHDHNSRTHIHVLAWGDKADLRMDKDDLSAIRDKAQELEIEREQIVDLDITNEGSLERDKGAELQMENDDKSLEAPL